MFEAIQNTYPKVQENEPVFSNVVPIKPSAAPTEAQQTQKQSQKQAVAEQLAFAKKSFEVGVATITDTDEAQAS